MSLLEAVLGQFGMGQASDAMAQKSGVDINDLGKVASIGLPSLLEALQRNAQDNNKRPALDQALQDHANDPIEQGGGYIQNLDNKDNEKMLDHILGDKRGGVEKSIMQQYGFDEKTVKNALIILAPIALSYLAKRKKNDNVSQEELPQMTKEVKQEVKKTTGQGGLFDSIGKMLDANNDGSVMDDLSGMLGKFLK